RARCSQELPGTAVLVKKSPVKKALVLSLLRPGGPAIASEPIVSGHLLIRWMLSDRWRSVDRLATSCRLDMHPARLSTAASIVPGPRNRSQRPPLDFPRQLATL